ncbi:bifunctional N-acetylglucosamine-1-phosphate uridyltransferase/glucosamine-1-phosphate acetyltransferase, partial [Salmonella enterica subsp. enterica serovar Enteritidis]
LTVFCDTDVVFNVNICTGALPCAYYVANIFKTIIGDDVFIGSVIQLVAPFCVSDGATIGACTTLTKDVNENELVISRVKQTHISGWKRPVKKKQ